MASPDPAASVGTLSVLVAEPVMPELVSLVSMLSRTGFHVTAAETFAQASLILSSRPPDVLVAAVRLGAYNGLHLVLRGKAIRPNMATIVTSSTADAMLQADAEALGATFVVKPIAEKELIAAVLQTYFRRSGTGPIRPPFERRVHNRRVSETSVPQERRVAERRRILPWLVEDACEQN